MLRTKSHLWGVTRSKYFGWLYVVAVLLVTAGTVLKFSRALEDIPVGCDEFGYLQLAESLDDGTEFGDHRERTYFQPLFDTLVESGFEPHEFTWMITPHAYHYDSDSKKIINQYAPATSFLLSTLPESYRQRAFPALILLLWFFLPYLLVWIFRGRSTANRIGVFLLLLFPLLTLHPSLSVELGRINSVAPTWGLLLTAGYFFYKQPRISIFLIALSANFRQVNLLFLLPFVIHLFPIFVSALRTLRLRPIIDFIMRYIGPAVIALLPYFYYAGQMLDNPLALTYSAIDTESATLATLLQNIRYYFTEDNGWFLIHLFFLLPIVFQRMRGMISSRLFYLALLLPILSYSFFLTHAVRIPYYPYASALLLAGIFLSTLNGEIKKGITIFMLVLPVVFFIDGANRYRGSEHLTPRAAIAKYESICPYDIVWGDLLTGTSEYACDNYGLLMHAGRPKARAIAFKHLHDAGYSQLILIEDTPLPREAIARELKAVGLTYEKVDLGELGEGWNVK